MRRSLIITVLTTILLAASCSSTAEEAVSNEESAPTADADGADSSSTSNTDSDTTEAPDTTTTAEPATTTEVPETTTTAVPQVVATDYGAPNSLEPDCSAVGAVSVGLGNGTITSGGLDYTYQWTVPSTYDGTPLPVVLDFHAIGSNGAEQAFLGGWAAKGEAEGFLAVQPTGVVVPGDDRASWELPHFESDLRDDLGMVVDLIDHIAQNICIDPSRVYATGMSNGGLFTSSVVCSLSQRIAAAASIAGVTHHESCDPVRAVPYLAFHGTDDTVVPFNGGGETTLDGADNAGGFFDQVIPDEFAEFAASFGCASSTDEAITEAITVTSYVGCEDDVPLRFYAISGAGHTWPGSQISNAIASLGVTNMDISATGLAWEFFQEHSLD